MSEQQADVAPAFRADLTEMTQAEQLAAGADAALEAMHARVGARLSGPPGSDPRGIGRVVDDRDVHDHIEEQEHGWKLYAFTVAEMRLLAKILDPDGGRDAGPLSSWLRRHFEHDLEAIQAADQLAGRDG